MPKPVVLVVHNRYRQPGGEDTVVRAEVELLRRAGHRVVQYSRSNDEILQYGAGRKASLLIGASWNARSYADLRALLQQEQPDIAHFHNTLPLVSPSAYYACRRSGVRVVQTLHNYRLLCPAGTLFRNGTRCDECARGWVRGPVRGCYRNSRLQTAAVSLMLKVHETARTWSRAIDVYITPSRFCRDRFTRGGLPAQKILHKPNFLVRDPGPRTGAGEYALFVGRLSEEKGVLEMLRAWRGLPEVPLLVAGDGPLLSCACALASQYSSKIRFLGRQSPEQTATLMRSARFLVFPSLWEEPFGMGLVEAAACGVPSVASRVGAIPEIVRDHETGLLFAPDDFSTMADSVRWAWTHRRDLEAMGKQAREHYLEQFTAERNYGRLMEIYDQALKN
jgi:glycosyltransferase involved in cell wall biosynthesis